MMKSSIFALVIILVSVSHAVDGFITSSRSPLVRRSIRPSTEDALADMANTANQLERFFFDQCEIFVRSGKGGEGALSSNGKRPAGGNGGSGGKVYIQVTDGCSTLIDVPGKKYAGADGEDGKQRETGSNGADCVIKVPPNCIVTRKDTNETLATLTHPGDRYLVCKGGDGGLGNGASGKPDKVTPPSGSKKMWLSLQMTLVADVGLIGFPNAGKSTLLRAVTRARPKVADYPFTTLVPNLGVCDTNRFKLSSALAMVFLDIPGLIEGASAGKGLGLAFLRHAERCRMLLHLVDGESKHPGADLLAINRELSQYSAELAAMPQAVLLTKVDLTHVKASLPEKLKELKAAAGHSRVIALSSADGTNVPDLLLRTHRLLRKMDHSKTPDTADSTET
mmetsp:Transcript_49539/g.84758  ORF Transcript_49539/g.84758 Transcript_49539/m.84758 type:complete len:394 (-) Transcript_49539:182-1363(-)